MAGLLSSGSPNMGTMHVGGSLASFEFKHNCLGLTTHSQDAPPYSSLLSHRHLFQSQWSKNDQNHQHSTTQDSRVGGNKRVPASDQANGTKVCGKLAASGTRLAHDIGLKDDECKRRRTTRHQLSAHEKKLMNQSIDAQLVGPVPCSDSAKEDSVLSTRRRKEDGKACHTQVQCVDQHVHELIWQWRNSNTLQEHYLDHVFLAEGFTHILGIHNCEVVLLFNLQVKKLVRFIPFYHEKFGFCWAAFELDQLGAVDSPPLAMVSREQLEVFALHTSMLDPVVGPRILRLLPFLGDLDPADSAPKRGRIEPLVATRAGTPHVSSACSSVGVCYASTGASASSGKGKRPKVANRKLAAGLPYFGDITAATWNAQSLCCDDANKLRRKMILIKQLAVHNQIIGVQETFATRGSEAAWKGPSTHKSWWSHSTTRPKPSDANPAVANK